MSVRCDLGVESPYTTLIHILEHRLVSAEPGGWSAGSGMSRLPINEEIYNLGSQLKRGMDSLTIIDRLDPNKMRIPFGGGCNGAAKIKRQSWMTVPSNSGNPNPNNSNNSNNPIPDGAESWPETGLYDVVMEIPKQSRAALTPVTPEPTGRGCHWEVHGWLLAVGYAVFGLSLALCNLLAPQHTSKVCTGVSPIPFLCLLLQALTCMDYDKSDKIKIWALGPGGLILSASALPSACILWSLYMAIPLVFVLSLSVFYCMRHRDVLACVCLSGVCLSLLLALPAPIQILEPRWGMTVGMFFACILCFLAGLGSGGVGFQIKLL